MVLICSQVLSHIQLCVIPSTVPRPAPWGFSRQEYWSGLPCPPLGNLPNPGIKPRSPTLQAGSLPSEPPGKSKNTGVGSLSLLQGIFLTQESNQGLLHCRSEDILYVNIIDKAVSETDAIHYAFQKKDFLGQKNTFSGCLGP